MPRVFRTTSFRLASLYATVFAASTGLLFAIVYWLASDVLRAQARVSIESEFHELARLDAGPAARLATEIQGRMAATHFLYGLYAADGTKIVGDFSSVGKREGWQILTTPNLLLNSGRPDAPDDPETVVLTLVGPLPSHRLLAVGLDMFPISEAQEAITRAFGWAGAVGVMLALFGGVFLSRRFLARVDTLNKGIDGIIAGHLHTRLGPFETGDELDHLGRNFNDMLDRLEASMDGLKRVTDDIAHDLRTPLSRLRQGLEDARADAVDVATYRAAVDRAIADADAILSTFAALLRVAQVEAGSRKAAFAPVDLSEVFRSVAEAYVAVAEDSGRVLHHAIADGVEMPGDRELLVQMLANLVENAIQHTPPGTEITLSLQKTPAGAVAVVADNGPGIPNDLREKVFQRFFRLERSRTTPGHGLGLSLVAAVASLHGIALALADNAPGLRVSFTVPRSGRLTNP